MHERTPTSWLGFYVAITATLLIMAVRSLLMDDLFGSHLPLYLFLFAVIVAAWVGGLRPGLFATVLGLAAGFYWFVERDGWSITRDADRWRIMAFVASGVLISWFADAMHGSRRLALRRQEMLRVTLASIGDAVLTTDDHGHITSLNPVAAELSAWTEGDAFGRAFQDVLILIDEDTRKPVPNPAGRVLAEGTIVGLKNHTILIAKDGSERPIEHSAAPIRDDAGKLIGVVMVFRDVSNRKQQEEALFASKECFRQLAEERDRFFALSLDLLCVVTLDARFQRVNSSFTKTTGYTEAELLTMPVMQFIHPEDIAGTLDEIEKLKRGEPSYLFETRFRCKDGSYRYLSWTALPVLDQQIIYASARDITDRHKIEQELREADRRKDEFLAVLAHELRNPLVPIRNGLELLRRAKDDEAVFEQARSMMTRQLEQMVHLVDDLLDVSRISQGRMVLRRECVSLGTILDSAIETSRPLIDASGHEFLVDVPDQPIFIDADVTRMAQVVSNLLNNSAKYTEPGGHIRLKVRLTDDDVTISVIDDGMGIPTPMLPRVFDMFTQVDSSLERAKGGLGIGLTLVKRLVELHNGSVRVVSEGLGKGSTFTVRLPTVGTAMVRLSDTGETSPASARRRILVVDDKRDSAISMAMLLRITGNETRTAHDGLEAIEVADEFRPDVILMDIGMPKLNGYDACRRIRVEPWGRQITIIALTGWGAEKDRQLSSEAGFTSHLVKPVDPDELETILARLE